MNARTSRHHRHGQYKVDADRPYVNREQPSPAPIYTLIAFVTYSGPRLVDQAVGGRGCGCSMSDQGSLGPGWLQLG